MPSKQHRLSESGLDGVPEFGLDCRLAALLRVFGQ
jgi:hypothetical protein